MQYDKELAARVWKRVQGTSAPPPQVQDPAGGLWEMILAEWQDGVLYQQLAGRFTGQRRQMLLQMAKQDRAHADCLKGVYVLITGKMPQIRQVKPETGPINALLRNCYGRKMQTLARYEAKSDDPQYGQVVRDLAAQERQHCRWLLELLGTV